jgi:hypothetical protein
MGKKEANLLYKAAKTDLTQKICGKNGWAKKERFF